MADETGFRFFNVIETDGSTEKPLGVTVVNDKGEFGFSNDTDEKPYLPAGGEKALSGEGVAESLIYDHFSWGSSVKLQETITSKTRQTAQTETAETKAEDTNKKTSKKEAQPDNAMDDQTVNSIEIVPEKESAKPTARKETHTKPVVTAPSAEGIEKDQLFEPAADKTKPLIPAEVEKDFVKVGNAFHFKSAPEKVAFKDKGNSLNTRNEGGIVSQSMIAIAKDRGWSEIKVTGSEAFKKDIWKKATAQGIAVRGYKPTKVEIAEMEGKGVEIPKQGQSLSPEKKINTPEQEAAKSFKEIPANEAVKKHPKLAPYIAAVAAIEKKMESEKMSASDKKSIMDRVRQNTELSINQGVVPNVTMKQKTKTLTAQQEVSR